MNKTLLLLSISLIVILFSCGTDDPSEYNGKWELITKPELDYNYFWELKDGNVSIYHNDTLGNVDTCATGEYIAKNKILTIVAPVNFCQWSTYDGEWDVHRHTSKFLTLIRYLPRGTIYLEFIKR